MTGLERLLHEAYLELLDLEADGVPECDREYRIAYARFSMLAREKNMRPVRLTH